MIGTYRRVKPSGKVNILGVLILIGIAGAIYWGVMIGPLYLQRTDAKGELQVGFNKFGLDKVPNIRKVMLLHFNDPELFGKNLQPNEQGVLVEVPGLGVTEDDLEYEPNDRLKELLVRLRYKRTIILRPTSKVKTYNFMVEVKGAYPH